MFEFSGVAGDRDSSRNHIELSETNHPQAKAQNHKVIPKTMAEADDFTPLRDLIRLLDRAV